LIPILVQSLFDDSIELNGKKVKVSPANIVKILKQYHYLLTSNGVFEDVIKEFFKQVFYFMNNHVLNFMLKKDTYCTMGGSIQLKMGLTQVENWASDQNFSNTKLEILRQISNVLMMQKEIFVDKDARKDICPELKLSQLAKLISQYHKDDFDPMAQVQKGTVEKITTETLQFADEFSVFNPIFKLVEMPSWKIVDLPKGLQGKEEFEFLSKK
jgi:hypothetical protein